MGKVYLVMCTEDGAEVRNIQSKQLRFCGHLFFLGCVRFPEILQNFRERQILWSMCSGVFLDFTLKLPIQNSVSVAPKFPVYKNVKISAKRPHPRVILHTEVVLPP